MTTTTETEKVWERQFGSINVYVTSYRFGEFGYKPWSGGCGIGKSFKKQEQAVEYCLAYVQGRLQRKKEELEQQLVEVITALADVRKEKVA